MGNTVVERGLEKGRGGLRSEATGFQLVVGVRLKFNITIYIIMCVAK